MRRRLLAVDRWRARALLVVLAQAPAPAPAAAPPRAALARRPREPGLVAGPARATGKCGRGSAASARRRRADAAVGERAVSVPHVADRPVSAARPLQAGRRARRSSTRRASRSSTSRASGASSPQHRRPAFLARDLHGRPPASDGRRSAAVVSSATRSAGGRATRWSSTRSASTRSSGWPARTRRPSSCT